MSYLNYDGIEFSVWEKDFSKIETKKNISINVLCYENELTSNIHFKSIIWELDGFVDWNWWKQVTLCVYQRFSQIYVSQNKK